jgi:hypothetical protein
MEVPGGTEPNQHTYFEAATQEMCKVTVSNHKARILLNSSPTFKLLGFYLVSSAFNAFLPSLRESLLTSKGPA